MRIRFLFTFAALALAFWRRSFFWGLLVVNAMVLIKIGWTGAVFDRAAFLAHLVPALIGLGLCKLAFAWFWHRHKTARH